jgi:hypothetical protein
VSVTTSTSTWQQRREAAHIFSHSVENAVENPPQPVTLDLLKAIGGNWRVLEEHASPTPFKPAETRDKNTAPARAATQDEDP